MEHDEDDAVEYRCGRCEKLLGGPPTRWGHNDLCTECQEAEE